MLCDGFNLAVSLPSDNRGCKARIVLLPSRITDEDINTIVTPIAPAAIHTGPITRARARQLNYQVLSFLGNDSNASINPRDPSGGPGTIPVTPETFPVAETGLPIYKSLPPDHSELLVTSGISSRTPNNFRVTAY